MNTHPTFRPLRTMKWLVSHYTQEGETILDPFAGSGTTLLAAKETGRAAVGIELEEKYCEIAVKRLRQGVFDLKTLSSSPAKHLINSPENQDEEHE